jgi:hypothetical protein
MWHPPAWTERASCNGHHEDFDEGRATSALSRMCQRCPVLEDCRRDVLAEELGVKANDRAGYRAGMTATARAYAEAQSAECPACGAPGGACPGCLSHAKTMRHFGGFIVPLRCIECGGPVSDNTIVRCTYCTDTSAGRWAAERQTA